MAAPKISIQDKKDLEKYTRNLAIKSIQIIVQSRLGEKAKTECKSEVSDWFSLAVTDLPEVTTEAKKVLQGDSTINRLPLCVEISLKTIDNDQMILENWTFGISQDQFDPGIKTTCTVYSRMSVMLKSLMSVTRVTPAYKLSRRQGADSFIIYYRIYSGEPQHHNLGEGYKQYTIGQVGSPIGKYYMSVAYRTKMTITPVQSQQGTSIMVKSDHFHSDLSPKHGRYSKQSDEKTVNLDEPMRAGAFVDVSKIKQYESDLLPEAPAFSWLLEDNRKKDDTYDSVCDMTDDDLSFKDEYLDTIIIDEDICALDLGDLDKKSESVDKIDLKHPWKLQPEDNKIMRELTCPFATAGPVGELANFYRECFNAPPLQSFAEAEVKKEESTPALEDPMFDITSQFERFETSLEEYDKLVTSLCQSPNNK